MRRKLRSWRAYAAVATSMVTLAGTAVLAAAPAQASTAGHTGTSSSLVRTAVGPPKTEGGASAEVSGGPEVGGGALHGRRV